jgi:hypothetical protein
MTGTSPQSPKDVVKAYRSMDANGERLTTDGWKKGNAFFLHPGPPPHDRVLGVMTGEIVGEPTVKGDKADVWTEFDFVGKVYPNGRFSRSVGGSPPLKGPVASGRKYSLVLSDQHPKLGTGHETAQGAPEWKIEDFEPNPMVTMDVAIRYLERLRDRTGSDDVKKNADRSISELTALRREWRH